MSMYGTRCRLIDEWIRKRAHMLEYHEWGGAVADFVGGGPWAHYANVKLADAAWRQAHAECFAYLCGQPIPDAKPALADLLKWWGDMSIPMDKEGAGGDLPDVSSKEERERAQSANANGDFAFY
jgi:hypothetical protein